MGIGRTKNHRDILEGRGRGPSHGRRFSRQLMPKIDKPSERELMKKKEREGKKKSQPAAEKRARRGTQIYACVHPGRLKTRVFETFVHRAR